MKVAYQAFWLPKSGNPAEDYDDAYAPREIPEANWPRLRLAVADGATESSYSGRWAKILARAYTSDTLSAQNLMEVLPPLQKRWRRYVGNKPLPWYAEQKLQMGAFAALVGLEIRETDHSWDALAVGDCCVFQTRNDELLKSFPLTSSEHFDNTPLLISSVPANNDEISQNIKTVSGTWEAGDTFFLMSDAMAAWFLRHTSLPSSDTLSYLRRLREEEFHKCVDVQRKDKAPTGEPMMRNDDVTLLSLTML